MFLRFFVLEINPTLSVSSANSKNDVSIISSNMLSPLNCNENAGWPFDLIVTLPLGNFRRFSKFITGEISLDKSMAICYFNYFCGLSFSCTSLDITILPFIFHLALPSSWPLGPVALGTSISKFSN